MKKIVACILICCSLLGVAGCKKGESSKTPASQDVSYYTVNSFETQGDFDLMTLNGYLGKVELNREQAFVKEGTGSAKVVLDTAPIADADPYLFHAFNNLKTGTDLRDFSSFDKITFQVYNAQNEDRNIKVQLVYPYSKGVMEKYLLKSGWNTVQYNVQRAYIPAYEDANKVSTLRVEGLNFIFERKETSDVFYMDDVKLYKTTKPFDPIVMKLEQDEICSFDNDWQIKMLALEGKGSLLPSVKQSTQFTSNGGGSSLEVFCPKGSGNYMVTNYWPGISLADQLIKSVQWGNYDESYRFTFDVYAPKENGVKTLWLSMYASGYRYFVSSEIPIKLGEWNTVSFSVEELNAQENSNVYNFAKTTSIAIRYGEEAEERVFYVDNVRMEK